MRMRSLVRRQVASLAAFASVLTGCSEPTPPPVAPVTTAVVDAGVTPATGPSPALADGGNPDFYACASDADCIAVPKLACCPTGHKEAVNKLSADAYAASFTCNRPRQMCPQYRILDKRVAHCSGDTHRCEMVDPAP